jgi:hypothetical protein
LTEPFFCRKNERTEKGKDYWLSMSFTEKLRVALYLQSIAYKFDFNNPHVMDKTVFAKEKRG